MTDAFEPRQKADGVGVSERHVCPPNVDICDAGDACWDICLTYGRWVVDGNSVDG